MLVFTQELMGTIATETNRYAQVCLGERYEKWECVTVEELYAYFGFLILMGMINLPSIQDYWKKDVVFNYRPLSSRISRTRFLDIHRFLPLLIMTCFHPTETNNTVRLKKSNRSSPTFPQSFVICSFPTVICLLMRQW